MGDDLHRLAEARSLALHRAVAEALDKDPHLVEVAREQILSWASSGRIAAPYAEAWLSILAAPLDDIRRAITADTQTARALRQTTPFTNVIDPRTRWRIWSEVRDQMGLGSRRRLDRRRLALSPYLRLTRAGRR